MPKPWERQSSESQEEPSRAFAAFQFYRDLGPARSLEKVSASVRAHRVTGGQKSGKEGALDGGGKRRVSSQVEDWSKKWNWVHRVRAWEEEQDRVKRHAMLAEIEEMGKRQAKQAQASAQVLILPVMAIARKLRNNPKVEEELEKLSVKELLAMSVSSAMFLRQMHAAEREARGVETGKTPAFGAAAAEASASAVTVSGAEFTWVQSNCTCGHPHSAHDQTDSDPSKVPCQTAGCKCQKFRDADDQAAA